MKLKLHPWLSFSWGWRLRSHSFRTSHGSGPVWTPHLPSNLQSGGAPGSAVWAEPRRRSNRRLRRDDKEAHWAAEAVGALEVLLLVGAAQEQMVLLRKLPEPKLFDDSTQGVLTCAEGTWTPRPEGTYCTSGEVEWGRGEAEGEVPTQQIPHRCCATLVLWFFCLCVVFVSLRYDSGAPGLWQPPTPTSTQLNK